MKYLQSNMALAYSIKRVLESPQNDSNEWVKAIYDLDTNRLAQSSGRSRGGLAEW